MTNFNLFSCNETVAILKVLLIFDNGRTDIVEAIVSTDDEVNDTNSLEGVLFDAFEEQTGIDFWSSELMLDELQVLEASLGNDLEVENVTIDAVVEVMAALAQYPEGVVESYIEEVCEGNVSLFNETIFSGEFIGVYYSDRAFIEETCENYGIEVDSYDLDESDLRHDYWRIVVQGGIAVFGNI